MKDLVTEFDLAAEWYFGSIGMLQWLPLFQLDEASLKTIVRTFTRSFGDAQGFIGDSDRLARRLRREPWGAGMLIVALTGAAGLLFSFLLLRAGVDGMALRYPLALGQGNFGSPGNDIQPQAMTQVFLNIVVFGMEPQAAVEAPRFATYSYPSSSAPHGWSITTAISSTPPSRGISSGSDDDDLLRHAQPARDASGSRTCPCRRRPSAGQRAPWQRPHPRVSRSQAAL